MNTFFEQLKKIRTLFTLSRDRKDAIRETLSHMVDMDVVARQNKHYARQFSKPAFARFQTRSLSFAASMGIMVLALGGTAFAAEQSLPGDFLYSVKIGVNEEVRAQLALSDEAKAEWGTRRVERRLEEATALAARGKIGESEEREIEVGFAREAEQAKEHISTLEAHGNVEAAAEIASRFEATLRGHEQVLASFATREGISPTSSAVVVRVRETGDRIAVVRELLEARLTPNNSFRAVAAPIIKSDNAPETNEQHAAEGKLAAARNVVILTNAFIEKKREQLGVSTIAAAFIRLQLATTKIDEGRANVQLGDYSKAFMLGNQAIRIANESKTIVSAESKWNIRVGVDDVETGSASLMGTSSLESQTEHVIEPMVRGTSTETIKTKGSIKANLGL